MGHFHNIGAKNLLAARLALKGSPYGGAPTSVGERATINFLFAANTRAYEVIIAKPLSVTLCVPPLPRGEAVLSILFLNQVFKVLTAPLMKNGRKNFLSAEIFVNV